MHISAKGQPLSVSMSLDQGSSSALEELATNHVSKISLFSCLLEKRDPENEVRLLPAAIY